MFEVELETFFTGAFERFLNEKLFYRDYQLDKQKMSEYTDRLVQIPIKGYIDYLVAQVPLCFVQSQDIVQFSSLNDATAKICIKILEAGDEGLRYTEIGQLLLDDGKVRKTGALKKYGENHAKTAVEFGLVQNKYDYIYLSCIGVVFGDYSIKKRNELLKRLILRNRFVQRLAILSQKGEISLEQEMAILSEATIKRRLPNIRTLFSLFDEDEILFFKNIHGLGISLQKQMPIDFAAESETN